MVQLSKQGAVKLNGAQDKNWSTEEESVWRREDFAADWAKSGSFSFGRVKQILI